MNENEENITNSPIRPDLPTGLNLEDLGGLQSLKFAIIPLSHVLRGLKDRSSCAALSDLVTMLAE